MLKLLFISFSVTWKHVPVTKQYRMKGLLEKRDTLCKIYPIRALSRNISSPRSYTSDIAYVFSDKKLFRNSWIETAIRIPNLIKSSIPSATVDIYIHFNFTTKNIVISSLRFC